MKTMMTAQKGKTVKKKTVSPVDDYKNMKDSKGKKGNMGGEGTQPPFTPAERKKMPKVGSTGSAKFGKTMKKAKNGTSLGMKSVKAGFDKNPGVTRADIIVAAKKKAKSGTKMKKAMMGAMSTPMMKSGGKMSKCKNGCK